MQLLAERVSNTGRATLQRALNGNAGNNVFSDYFTAGDRLCLTGLAWRNQATARTAAADHRQAAQDYAIAARAFAQVAERLS